MFLFLFFFLAFSLCSDKHFMREYLQKVFDKCDRCGCFALLLMLLLVDVGCCCWGDELPALALSFRPFAISFWLWQKQLFCNYVATSRYTRLPLFACVSMCNIVVTCSFIDINMNKCDRLTSADCTTSKKRFQENILKIQRNNNNSCSQVSKTKLIFTILSK